MDLEKIKEDGYHVLIGDYKPHDEKIIDIKKIIECGRKS